MRLVRTRGAAVAQPDPQRGAGFAVADADGVDQLGVLEAAGGPRPQIPQGTNLGEHFMPALLFRALGGRAVRGRTRLRIAGRLGARE